jgi:hypothetical protein
MQNVDLRKRKSDISHSSILDEEKKVEHLKKKLVFAFSIANHSFSLSLHHYQQQSYRQYYTLYVVLAEARKKKKEKKNERIRKRERDKREKTT